MQPVLNGCECGNALCLSCLKNHKDLCQKGAKVKSLKEFKEEYFLNVMYKLRQVTFYREKLVEDRGKYEMHYQQQK